MISVSSPRLRLYAQSSFAERCCLKGWNTSSSHLLPSHSVPNKPFPTVAKIMETPSCGGGSWLCLLSLIPHSSGCGQEGSATCL